MNKLIEKALSRQPRTRKPAPSQEEMELALAWLGGKVSHAQISYACGVKTGSTQSWLVCTLRAAFSKGMISVRKESTNEQ